MVRVLRRYAFTVAGIAIGVAGLTALGAMSERILRFIEGGDRFVLGQISVAGPGLGPGVGFTAGGLLRAATVRAIAAVEGVAAVQPQVMLPLDPSTSQFMTLTHELLLGLDPAAPMPNRYYPTLPVAEGRPLRAGDRRVAVVGAAFAAARRLRVGDPLVLDGERFTVVGILERTLTAPDRFVIVPLADAREHWLRKDPLLRTVLASGAAALTADDLNTGVAVGWREGEDPDVVARRIRERVPGVSVQIPSELSALLRSSMAFFTALILGIVGGVLGIVAGIFAMTVGGIGAAFAAGDGPAEAAEAPPAPAAGKPAAREGTAVEGGSGNARALPPEEALAGVPRGQAAEKTASGSCEPRAEGQAAASSPRPAAETSRPEHEGGRRLAAQTAAPADPHPAARARTHADSQGVAPPAVEEEATPAPGPAAEASAPAAAAKRPLPAEAHAACSPEQAAGPAESPEACAAGPRGLKAEAPLSPRAPVSPAAAAERELPGMPSRSQVFDPIVQRATLQVRGGREEIRIELKPEFLGPVRMQIATASQAVSVRILAEVPLVRDWIEAGLAQLKSELEQQGLRVERLEVAVAADGREGSARREEFRGPYAFPQASQTGSAPPIGPAHPPGWELAPGLRQAAAGPGRLDLFA